MTIKIPISYPHMRLDSSAMHNRKDIKRAELHSDYQIKVDTVHSVKKQDYDFNRAKIKDWSQTKDIEEINNYLNLKKHIESGLYRYSISLGTNLDIYV